MRNTLNGFKGIITVGGCKISDIRCVDDIVLIWRSMEDLQCPHDVVFIQKKNIQMT